MGYCLHFPGVRAQLLRALSCSVLPRPYGGCYPAGAPSSQRNDIELISQGSITYLSIFYCRAELGKRVAIFFSATSLAGAFSGLLAAAILNMDGKGGKAGWAWIFILYMTFPLICTHS
jgi:hypothetical protein